MKRILYAGLLAAAACAGGPAAAAVINVPAQQATIQAGIDAAGGGDTVLVAPGWYQENPLIRNKTVVLASRYIVTGTVGTIDSTVIDGSQPASPDSASCIRIIGDPVNAGATTMRRNTTFRAWNNANFAGDLRPTCNFDDCV